MSLTGISEEHPHPHRNQQQQQQQQQQSGCYTLNDRLLCLHCHLRRLPPPATTTTLTTTTAAASSSSSSGCDSGICTSAGSTCWTGGYHDNVDQVTWRPSCSLYVDVTLDGDASSSCTTASDDVISDVTAASDDVISSAGSDVTAPASTAAVS